VDVAAYLAVVLPARKEMRATVERGGMDRGGEATATAAVVATTATVTGSGDANGR